MDDLGPQVVTHDDGVFRFPKELVHAPLSLERQAAEVISSYRARERERVLALKKPVTAIRNLPEKEVVKIMHDRAGRGPIAMNFLQVHSTRWEHENARSLDSFLLHVEPDYYSQEYAARYHETHCWGVALLNAFRLLDLLDAGEIEFPFHWIPIAASPEDSNFGGLVSSAAYLMGHYHAKAMAMRHVDTVERGRTMSSGRTGKLSDHGQLIQEACLSMMERGEPLRGKNMTKRVMEMLETMGLGKAGSTYEINGKAVGAKTISSHIARARDRVEKSFPFSRRGDDGE